MIIPDARREKKIVILFLVVFAIVTVVLAALSTSTYESGDSIQHFLISKYAFKHPYLFVDHWGKPFFVLLSSPFSQVGFLGINIFNISCAVGTGYISYLTAKKMGLSFSILAPVFSLMAPIYYVTLISGLTEPLFGLVLIGSIYLFMNEKYVVGSILISFLPFVRTEGFFLLPLFGLVLLISRGYKAIPLLILGTLLYSAVGSFYYHDLLWVLHQNPYKGAYAIYGSGSLFHFVGKNEFILGTPLVILFLIGCVFSFSRNNRPLSINTFILVLGSFFLYLFFHSIFWWKGIFGSLGLIRVMAGIMPLAGIVSLIGLDTVYKIISKYVKQKNVFPVFCALLIISILIMPFKQHSFPRKLDYEEVVVKQASDWIQQSNLQGNKQYYLFPYYAVFLDIDPFDTKQAGAIWEVNDNITNVKAGEFIVWDNHYCPNEGQLPLTVLQNNTAFEQLAHFTGDRTITPGDKDVLEVFIFKRNP